MTDGVLEVGRQAGFVLAAYAVTAVVLVGAVADTLLRNRRWKREVETLESRRSEPGLPGETPTRTKARQ